MATNTAREVLSVRSAEYAAAASVTAASPLPANRWASAKLTGKLYVGSATGEGGIWGR